MVLCVVVCAQVITASVDGQVMVWDLRMLRCVQTFHDTSSVGLDGGMNCFETCPSRKQIVCAGKSLTVYRQVRRCRCLGPVACHCWCHVCQLPGPSSVSLLVPCVSAGWAQ